MPRWLKDQLGIRANRPSSDGEGAAGAGERSAGSPPPVADEYLPGTTIVDSPQVLTTSLEPEPDSAIGERAAATGTGERAADNAAQAAEEQPATAPADKNALEHQHDLAFGEARRQRAKPGRKPKRRDSEFSRETGEYEVHPHRMEIPCFGPVDDSAGASLHTVFTDTQADLVPYLQAKGRDSCADMTTADWRIFVKETNPYKWIVSEDMKIMIGRSKVPVAADKNSPADAGAEPVAPKYEKKGHVMLVGGSEDPKGRIGGLMYCTKDAQGNFKLRIDNDSGRFGSGEDRNIDQLKNVANRLRECTNIEVEIDWLPDVDGRPVAGAPESSPSIAHPEATGPG